MKAFRSGLKLTFCLAALVAFPGMDETSSIRLAGCDMRMTFSEDFNHFDVQSSVYGGKGWIAHTPWAGDFGDAVFTDPAPGFPFKVKDGDLQIEARKDADGRWRSGLLASADSNGRGFAQTYGYFEMKAMLPKGDGTWPAFWLATNLPKGSSEPALEVDALEHYGRFPGDFHSGFHLWHVAPPNDLAKEHITPVEAGSLYSHYHQYGVDVEPDMITYYFDHKETWHVQTPSQHKKPLLILLNLALGSGWPIDKTPNPSIMTVAYVKVFQREDASCHP